MREPAGPFGVVVHVSQNDIANMHYCRRSSVYREQKYKIIDAN